MRILAIDIGTGTQDIVLYDTEKEVENSILMVMPSPTIIIAEKIYDAATRRRGIFLFGSLMGGGPLVRAIRQHLQRGLKVCATPDAALTIHDDLDRVRRMGVVITEAGNVPDGLEAIHLQDVDLQAIGTALASFGAVLPEHIAVAVQDHGNSPETSNRINRFRKFEKLLLDGGELERFAYGPHDIPYDLTRIRAAAQTLGERGVNFMDTGPAAIFGALFDPAASQPALVVNIGNGHTLAAIVADNRITALYEHHSSSLTGERLQEHLIRFANGELSFDEIFEEGGHGCCILNSPGVEALSSVMVTGPRLNLLKNMDIKQKDMRLWTKLHFAVPFGNMMLTGCYGLLASYLPR